MQRAVYLFMRDGAALVALRYPILTLDERQLTPALGYIFNVRWLLPGESIVSILWKFARANGLPGHTLVHLLGADVDAYEGVEAMRDVFDLRHVARMLRLPEKILRASLLDPGQRGRHHSGFRYCRQCLTLGFHSVRYQMFSENRCPAHSRSLETQCHGCGGESPYFLNACLIGSPYRCTRCGALYGKGHPPVLSEKPAMGKKHRVALSRHFYNRTSGSFCISENDRAKVRVQRSGESAQSLTVVARP